MEKQMERPLSNPEKVLRLSQCLICGKWTIEKLMHPVEVPDQAGCIRKLACKTCLEGILGDTPEATK